MDKARFAKELCGKGLNGSTRVRGPHVRIGDLLKRPRRGGTIFRGGWVGGPSAGCFLSGRQGSVRLGARSRLFVQRLQRDLRLQPGVSPPSRLRPAALRSILSEQTSPDQASRPKIRGQFTDRVDFCLSARFFGDAAVSMRERSRDRSNAGTLAAPVMTPARRRAVGRAKTANRIGNRGKGGTGRAHRSRAEQCRRQAALSRTRHASVRRRWNGACGNVLKLR